MLRRFFGSDDLPGHAERLRRFHSAWLTWALRRGGAGLPRIPVRAVSEGGYGPLMATSEGREWAEAWWGDALSFEERN